jgi:hypothetical protein
MVAVTCRCLRLLAAARGNTDLHALDGDAADADAGNCMLVMAEGERAIRRLRCGVRYVTDRGAEARSSSSNKFSSPPSTLSATSAAEHVARAVVVSVAGAEAGALNIMRCDETPDNENGRPPPPPPAADDAAAAADTLEPNAAVNFTLLRSRKLVARDVTGGTHADAVVVVAAAAADDDDDDDACAKIIMSRSESGANALPPPPPPSPPPPSPLPPSEDTDADISSSKLPKCELEPATHKRRRV